MPCFDKTIALKKTLTPIKQTDAVQCLPKSTQWPTTHTRPIGRPSTLAILRQRGGLKDHTSMSLLDDLQWRYAAKHLNGQPVAAEDVEYILQAAQLAPTSSGLQPFHVFVISNPQLIAQLSQCVYGNQQVKNCSPLLVFAAWNQYTPERINEVFSRQNDARQLPDSVTDHYRLRLIAQVEKQALSEQRHHADKQAFLAAMCAMTAAAEKRIDCTPMEGFEADKVDAILNLAALDLHTTLLLPLGHRDEKVDWLLQLKKYRRPMQDLVTHLD